MKKYILLSVFLFSFSSLFAQNPDSTVQETTLIFVRHAEKMDDQTKDPSLNEQGEERAEKLAKLLLKDYHISAIYCTKYKRTQETAKPLADSLNVEVMEYNLDDPNLLIERIIEDHSGQEVLVVGHSNTTPLLVNIALGTGKYDKLDENSYGEMFIVQISSIGKAGAERTTY